MRRALIVLILVLAASALPARWAAAQLKNEGVGVLLPPTRSIPDPAPPPMPVPTPSPAPAQGSSNNPPAPPPPAGRQQAK